VPPANLLSPAAFGNTHRSNVLATTKKRRKLAADVEILPGDLKHLIRDFSRSKIETTLNIEKEENWFEW